MLPPVLKTIVEEVGNRLYSRHAAVWIRTDADTSDLDAIREAGSSVDFDPLRLRAGLLESGPRITARELRQKDSWRILAKVVVVCERGRIPQIPWNLYRDIFLAFGACKGKGPWRVIVFCAKAVREFPPEGQEPGAEHVNGGYAIPGDPRSIVIYREEESYRVLLHELLHACGSDDMSNSEWLREALTETWAELFLIGVLAKGNLKRASGLWAAQAQWIADQEFLLRQRHSVRGPENYAYRYTVGRRDVLKELGVGLPPAGVGATPSMGLRFTSPLLVSGN